MEIPPCARHLKLIFFESPPGGATASQQHPGKRDLTQWDRRETSDLSAGELQRKVLKQLLHLMVFRRDRRKVSS